MDRLFGALAEPARLAMLERLSRGPAPVSELAGPLAMSLPGALQHLQVLEAAGLVSSVKSGRVRTCRLEAAALDQAEHWIAERRAEWLQRLDRLEAYLQSTPSKEDTHG